MSIKPILFNTEMVKAILDGRKTQTRRVVKLKYNNTQLEMRTDKYGTRLVEAEIMTEDHRVKKPDGTTIIKIRAIEDRIPPYKRGDILWVRETWAKYKNGGRFIYRADADGMDAAAHYNEYGNREERWCPSIHMPREAARIFLRVTDVRVERLQDITVLDAIREGCCGAACDCANAVPGVGCTDCYDTGWLERPETEFALLWDSTIKKNDLHVYGWNENPWVWVISFERCEKPADEESAAAKWDG